MKLEYDTDEALLVMTYCKEINVTFLNPSVKCSLNDQFVIKFGFLWCFAAERGIIYIKTPLATKCWRKEIKMIHIAFWTGKKCTLHLQIVFCFVLVLGVRPGFDRSTQTSFTHQPTTHHNYHYYWIAPEQSGNRDSVQ